MNIGLSDRVRTLAKEKYVTPAIRAGKMRFFIRVKDLLGDLQKEGFPAGHTPQVCTALRTAKFLHENGLEMEEVVGPPSKMSTTVVFHYRIAKPEARLPADDGKSIRGGETAEETPEARAFRLTEGLRGLLKEEMAEFGGAEGFLRWVRGYDEEGAA